MCIGFIGFAGFVMYNVYWLLYTFHLYMKVTQPQCSMLFDSWHHTKRFYYFEVGIFTIIGIVPYMILAGLHQFVMVHFPLLYCCLDAAGSFYGLVLPIVIVNCATMITLLLVLYHVSTVSDTNSSIVTYSTNF